MLLDKYSHQELEIICWQVLRSCARQAEADENPLENAWMVPSKTKKYPATRPKVQVEISSYNWRTGEYDDTEQQRYKSRYRDLMNKNGDPK